MNQILDFLVENYVYVAATSGFFIIVLIGFLVKDSRKKKKAKNAEEPVKEIKEIVSVPEVVEPITNSDTVLSNEPVVKEETPIVEPAIDLTKAQLADQRFEVVLEKNKPEILDFDENIVFDQKKLDEVVDIIDLTSLNNFQSKDEVASPKE